MNPHLLPGPTITITLNIFIILIAKIRLSDCANYENFTDCNSLYECGLVRDIGYPFWGGDRPQHCGREGFELKCRHDQGDVYPVIQIDKKDFRVEKINLSLNTMTIARTNLWDETCADNFFNTSLGNNIFEYSSTVEILNIFSGCTPQVNISVRNNFTCLENNTQRLGYYVDDSFLRIGRQNVSACENSYRVPVSLTVLDELMKNGTTLKESWNVGFDLWFRMYRANCSTCEFTDGMCGSNVSSNEFLCHCKDKAYPGSCPKSEKRDWPLKLGIGIAAAFTGIIITCIIFVLYHRRYRKKLPSEAAISRNVSSSHPSSIMNFEKDGIYYGLHLFSYGELVKATNKFDSSKEVGDGGFGTVYYGKLQDGRAVAVKRLYESNYKRVEQFINEVEILTRLRHKNLVSLYGCTSQHCRELLLVYEYIPNGTVADHLHGQRAAMTWPIRLKIAKETAEALAYLHASDIIHRDVKTSNILLDDNYGVKVADFGLSRLFPTDVTHVSTAPQGTPGYVDPEYHQCYQLTDKSDVYSFGVVLIELISSKPAVDITRHRHEINLSNMAISKIQNHELHELVDPLLGFESNEEVRRSINAMAELAFQCLQSVKDMRPSMEEVLMVLKDIESEQVYCNNKAEEMEIPADDVVLLRTPNASDEV